MMVINVLAKHFSGAFELSTHPAVRSSSARVLLFGLSATGTVSSLGCPDIRPENGCPGAPGTIAGIHTGE